MTARDPETPEQWQQAVDAAEFLLALDSARQYGLITGGPKVHTRRCAQILSHGKAQGYTPKPIAELCRLFIKGGN